MKVLLFILMLAIAFGGYTTAAHAFGDEACNSAMSAGQDHSDKDTPNDKNSAKSVDYHHCCASQAMNVNNDAREVVKRIATFMPPTATAFKSAYQFSLLRPPRTLV